MLRHNQKLSATACPQRTAEWHTLYEACQSPNPIAQSRAYQQLQELLLPRARYCLYTKPGLQSEAVDCVQDALLDIWKSFATQRGPTQQAQSFQSWCLTIVSRKVLDLLRRPTHRMQVICLWDLEEDAPITEELDVEEMTVNRLSFSTLFQDAIDHPALTPLQRQVLWLHCVEELDYAEIAQRLHKNITTIRVNRHRAIVALQKDAAFMARIGGTLGVHCPSPRQDMGRQGIDW